MSAARLRARPNGGFFEYDLPRIAKTVAANALTKRPEDLTSQLLAAEDGTERLRLTAELRKGHGRRQPGRAARAALGALLPAKAEARSTRSGARQRRLVATPPAMRSPAIATARMTGSDGSSVRVTPFLRITARGI
jgi:hypothetical protein